MPLLRLYLGFSLLVLAAMALAAPMPSNTIYLDAARGPEAVTAHRLGVRTQVAAFARVRDLLARKRAVPARAVPPCLDTFLVTPGAVRDVRPTRDTSATPVFTFAYSGFTADEQTKLSTFLGDQNQGAYQKLVDIYGPPLTGGTVTLAESANVDEMEGGEFDPGTMTISLPALPADFSSGDTSFYGMHLMHLLLHAFHAPAIISFDAWEEGMARAAALVAYSLIHPDFDPIYDMEYLLPLYDILNQPSLSTPSIFTGSMTNMELWRIGMATSVWLKIYGENSSTSIFKLFNAAYDAQYAAGNTTLPGSLNSLKALMSAVTPTVEGQPFLTWYDQQYVLRPITMVGSNIFLYAVPLLENCPLIIHYFTTSQSTDNNGHVTAVETPLNGTARLDFTSWDGIALFPEEGYDPSINYNQVSIPTGSDAGVGTLDPSFYNIGDPPTQRVHIKVTIGGQSVSTNYAYYARGTDAAENDFFGALTGADTGTLHILVPGIILPDVRVVQGAFSLKMPTGKLTFFAPIVFQYVSTDNTVTASFRRNIGPGFYAPLLGVTGPQTTALTHTFFAGPAIISFPITPKQTDVAQLFGVTDPTFPFTWWDPSLAGANKYRHYPDVPAVTPGAGYWLNLTANQTITITGAMPADSDPRAVTLQPGWNLIGNTYNAALNPWAMTVTSGTASFSLMDAITQGIISPVWMYDQQAGYGLQRTLSPWQGAWIANQTGGALVLQQQNATRNARSVTVDPMSLLSKGGWGMSVQARTAHSSDTMAYLGVAPTAGNGQNWLKPPSIGDGVRLALVNPLRQASGAIYATDVRQSIGTRAQWTLVVTCKQVDQVVVNWPDMRAVPAQYEVTLQDQTSGVNQALRTTPAYTYTANGTADHPDVRTFLLTIAPRGGASPLFLQCGTAPSRDKLPGAGIQFTLSSVADVTMEVRTVTGRLVSSTLLPSSRALQPITIPWNGRNTAGSTTAAGPYLITLTARTPDGQVGRQVLMVQARR